MQVESRYDRLTHEEKIDFLRRCDAQKDDSFSAARWAIYENVVSDWLSNKNIECVSINEIDSQGVSKTFGKLKFDKLIVDNIPTSFKQVEEKFLYKPRYSNYPLCDMFYKKGKI